MSAMDHLKALEEATFGADVRRIGQHIERGHGSRFAKLDEPTNAKFAALDRLLEAERTFTIATADLATAQARHSSAQAAYDAAERAAIDSGAMSTTNAGVAA